MLPDFGPIWGVVICVTVSVEGALGGERARERISRKLEDREMQIRFVAANSCFWPENFGTFGHRIISSLMQSSHIELRNLRMEREDWDGALYCIVSAPTEGSSNVRSAWMSWPAVDGLRLLSAVRFLFLFVASDW
jgi:hypothetical protein